MEKRIRSRPLFLVEAALAAVDRQPPADQIVGLENGVDGVMTSANGAATKKRANFETSNLGHVARDERRLDDRRKQQLDYSPVSDWDIPRDIR